MKQYLLFRIRAITSVALMFSLLSFALPTFGQGIIKRSQMVKIETDDWFSVWVECYVTYEVRRNEVYVRIENGRLLKNPRSEFSEYYPLIYFISASLSTKKDQTWTRTNTSNSKILDVLVPPPGSEIDLSCIPEVQCYEFSIPIENGIDLSKYWLTFTLESSDKRRAWFAHHNGYSSSFF